MSRGRTMMRVSMVLVVGLVVIALLAAITLSETPRTRIAANAVTEEGEIADVRGNTRVCQAGELLPRGTSAVRLAVNMALGARIGLELSAAGRVIAHGVRASGWRGADVTVPIQGTSREAHDVTVCASFGASGEPVGLIGGHTPAATAASSNGRPLPGRVKLEYLGTAGRSWWAMATQVTARMGRGRGWPGAAGPLLAALLMLVLISLTSWLAREELR